MNDIAFHVDKIGGFAVNHGGKKGIPIIGLFLIPAKYAGGAGKGLIGNGSAHPCKDQKNGQQ